MRRGRKLSELRVGGAIVDVSVEALGVSVSRSVACLSVCLLVPVASFAMFIARFPALCISIASLFCGLDGVALTN